MLAFLAVCPTTSFLDQNRYVPISVKYSFGHLKPIDMSLQCVHCAGTHPTDAYYMPQVPLLRSSLRKLAEEVLPVADRTGAAIPASPTGHARLAGSPSSQDYESYGSQSSFLEDNSSSRYPTALESSFKEAYMKLVFVKIICSI